MVQTTRIEIIGNEITESTLRGYMKGLKLVYEMDAFSVPQKQITRGLHKSENYADDEFLGGQNTENNSM